MERHSKPYIFISYAHKNSAAVAPAIAKMQAQGIQLWYDNGIEAGSEWPEYIAEKVVNCEKFVLFVSQAYLQSQNCKRELNFAISRKKEILSVFLEEVELSPGMEMQLGTYQAVFRNRFANAESFHTSLAGEPFFNACRQKQEAINIEDLFGKTESESGIKFGTRPIKAKKADDAANREQPKQLPEKSRTLAAVLSIFLGSFGVHKFYLGKLWLGLVYAALCWTYVPLAVGVVEGIILLTQSDEVFAKKNRCTIKQKKRKQ